MDTITVTYKKMKPILIVLVVLLAIFLRIYAISHFEKNYSDFDEQTYVPIAKSYSEAIKKGDIGFIVHYKNNIEHPIFIKLLFAQGIIIGEKLGYDMTNYYNQQNAARAVSVTLGVLSILLIALISPFAGFLYAIFTWHIKYSSQAMFDSGASFFAILALFIFMKWRKEKTDIYLYISAAAMGMAFASKYIIATTFLTILPFLFKSKNRVKNIILYFAIFGIVFFICDPILWSDPVSRLKESLFFHESYSQGSDVQRANLPWFMQIMWLIISVPWHEIFIVKLDNIIFITSIFGLILLKKESKLLFAWYVVNAVCLLIYPTKWPQYILIIIPVVCISSDLFIRSFVKQKIQDYVKFRKNIVGEQEVFWYKISIFSIVTVLAGIMFFLFSVIVAKTDFTLRWIFLVIATILILFGMLVTFIGIYKFVKYGNRERRDNYKNLKVAYTFIFPTILVSFVIIGLPIIFGFFVSLTDYSSKIGFDKIFFPSTNNFGWIFFHTKEGNYFWNNFFMTFWWTMLSTIIALVIGLVLALILNHEDLKLRGIYKTLLLLPWVVPGYIVVSAWKILFQKDLGAVNTILQALSIPRFNWYKDEFVKIDFLNNIPVIGPMITAVFGVKGYLISMPFLATLFINVWMSFPFIMIVCMSALKSIPDDYYEYAEIDGAGTFEKFRYITFPLIKPLIFPGVVVSMIWSFNNVNMMIIFASRSKITLLSADIYRMYLFGNYSFAAAYTIVVFFILLGYIIFLMKMLKIEKIEMLE